MPLSKARDRARKQAERDKVRLEGKENTGFVQPNRVIRRDAEYRREGATITYREDGEVTRLIELDADGNPIYEEM